MTHSSGLPEFIIRGAVDTRRLSVERTGSGIVSALKCVDENRWECVLPGVSITWNSKLASHSARDELLCIVWGTPRLGVSEGAAIAPLATATQIMERLFQGGSSALAES